MVNKTIILSVIVSTFINIGVISLVQQRKPHQEIVGVDMNKVLNRAALKLAMQSTYDKKAIDLRSAEIEQQLAEFAAKRNLVLMKKSQVIAGVRDDTEVVLNALGL